MARKRTNFSDKHRAEIFVMDGGICSYCGRSLWILDYGLDTTYRPDWVEHLKPAARGGPSTPDNGCAACATCNQRRSTGESLRQFERGVPNRFHASFVGQVSQETKFALRRSGRMESSDWFLNRGLWHLTNALTCQVLGPADRHRDHHYYTKVSMNYLDKWRSLAAEQDTDAILARLPLRTEDIDQLGLLHASTFPKAAGFKGWMKALRPRFESILIARTAFEFATTDAERAAAIKAARKDKLLPRRIADHLDRLARDYRHCTRRSRRRIAR